LARKPDVDPAALRELLRRALGTSAPLRASRTPDGVSTQVYRISRRSQVFYLRVAEYEQENLETDAELHRRLGALGVKVPDVVYVEPFDAALGRSVMITTEIPGVPAASLTDPTTARSVVREAGAQLALLNAVPVNGFGWVRRDGAGWPLTAQYRDYPPFVTAYLPAAWPGALATLFPAPVLDAFEDLIDRERHRPVTRARLAHGDFDTTPIFCQGGRYTGLIDFGEIRGTEPFFDLGHFHLHDAEGMPFSLLDAVVAGYREVTPLGADARAAIRRSAILLGLRQLGRWIGPDVERPLDHPAVVDRARRLTHLAVPGGR